MISPSNEVSDVAASDVAASDVATSDVAVSDEEAEAATRCPLCGEPISEDDVAEEEQDDLLLAVSSEILPNGTFLSNMRAPCGVCAGDLREIKRLRHQLDAVIARVRSRLQRNEKFDNKSSGVKDSDDPTSLPRVQKSRYQSLQSILQPPCKESDEEAALRVLPVSRRLHVSRVHCNDPPSISHKKKNHEDTSGGGKSVFVCEECGLKFTSKQNLRFHQSRHSGIFELHCKQCGKGFSNNQLLYEHSLTHTGVKPFKCDQCDQSFSNRGSLWAHRKRHKAARPYICPHCSRGFKHSSHLAVHRRRHTGESPYSCSECSQSFISATYLTRHKKRHSKPGLKDLTSETLMTHAENSKVEPVHREKVRASGQDLSRTVVFVRLGEGGDPQ